MSRLTVFLGFLICFLAIGSFVATEFAEARKFGGSKSFGSRPSQQTPAQRPAQTQRETPNQQQTQQNRQTGQQQTAQQTPARSGLGGMFGGMLGGLLLGGLIGSLLSGGLGAFSGINFLDILVFGGILFLLYRFFRSRRPATQSAGPMGAPSPLAQPARPAQPTQVHHRSATHNSSPEKSAWDALNSEPAGTSSPEVKIPEGFDVDDFLTGAKAAYTRLQNSWNNRDLDDIRNFTTREVFAEIKRQQSSAPLMGQTELLVVEASLLEVREEDDDTVCSVLFDVLLREDPLEEAKQTQEIWHFSRPSDGTGMWLLEGIQQVN